MALSNSPLGWLLTLLRRVVLFESLRSDIKIAPVPHGMGAIFMALEGFEPLTSRMRSERSPN